MTNNSPMPSNSKNPNQTNINKIKQLVDLGG